MMQRIALFLFLMLTACDGNLLARQDVRCGDTSADTGVEVELGPVAWMQGLYQPRPGVEFRADVLSVDSLGVAELLITGIHDTAPAATTVSAPCRVWAGPGLIRRPRGVVWAWDELHPDGRVGIFAGLDGAGQVRAAFAMDPEEETDVGAEVAVLPVVPAPEGESWVPDPSLALPKSTLMAWAGACRKGP